MCSICHQYKCPAECPNYYLSAVGSCDICGDDFHEGDTFYRFEDLELDLCEECLENAICYDEGICCVCGEKIADGEKNYDIRGNCYCCDCVADCKCEAGDEY